MIYLSLITHTALINIGSNFIWKTLLTKKHVLTFWVGDVQHLSEARQHLICSCCLVLPDILFLYYCIGTFKFPMPIPKKYILKFYLHTVTRTINKKSISFNSFLKRVTYFPELLTINYLILKMNRTFQTNSMPKALLV